MRGVEERRRWDALLAKHHYLPFHGLFGKSLRHVAVRGEAWLALLGWQAGAFKVGVRDAWIGWSREQQFSRLHLVANNSRFAVLEAGRVPNLASRGAGSEPAAAVARHPGRARVSGAAGGDLRGPVAVRGHVLPGVELASAGAHAGLFARTGRDGALARARPGEGGVRVRDGHGRGGGVAPRRAARGLAGGGRGRRRRTRPSCAACMPFWRAWRTSARRAGAATGWPATRRS